MPRKKETKHIEVYTTEKNVATVHDLAQLRGKKSMSEYILELIERDAALLKKSLEPTPRRGKYERKSA